MTIQAFDKNNLSQLRTDLDKVLKQYGLSEGLVLDLGNIRFTSTEFSAKLNVKIAGSRGLTEMKQNIGSAQLENRIRFLGLKAENDQGWKLTDYKSANWKMPYIFTRNGKSFKCSEEQAKMYFR